MAAGWLSSKRGSPAKRGLATAPIPKHKKAGPVSPESPAPVHGAAVATGSHIDPFTGRSVPADAFSSPELMWARAKGQQLAQDILELLLLASEVPHTCDVVQRLLQSAESFDPAVEAKVYALTAGQIAQISCLFSPADADKEPIDQAAVVIQYLPDGPSGPGLYAQRDGEGSIVLLDGRPTRRSR